MHSCSAHTVPLHTAKSWSTPLAYLVNFSTLAFLWPVSSSSTAYIHVDSRYLLQLCRNKALKARYTLSVLFWRKRSCDDWSSCLAKDPCSSLSSSFKRFWVCRTNFAYAERTEVLKSFIFFPILFAQLGDSWQIHPLSQTSQNATSRINDRSNPTAAISAIPGSTPEGLLFHSALLGIERALDMGPSIGCCSLCNLMVRATTS